MKRLLLSSAAVAALVGQAYAADLPARTYAPVLPPPPAFTWTGFYVGVNAGASWSGSSVTPVLSGAFLSDPYSSEYRSLYGTKASNNSTGFTGGGQIGYNWQVANFVFGLEGDINYQNNDADVRQTAVAASPLSGTINKTFHPTDGWFATIRPRFGIAFGQALVYATGGLAVGDERSKITITDNTNNPYTWSGSSDDTRTGWVVGGGLEYALNQNWTIKGEYLYVDLGTRNFALANAASNSIQAYTMGVSEKDRFSVARLGVNYKF
jgi:outer membrane immunogenic protein